jgi:aspartyl-tRNA(Asn)/glutamyl-tRNA(Gln) amidotransferase subunit A
MNKTIREIATLLDLGKVTSSELVDSAMEEIENDKGQGRTVFIKIYPAQAKAQAIAIDKLRAAGVALSPIAGVPISIKDLFDVAGEITTAGSQVRKMCAPAIQDADIVKKLRLAGAILMGRTNMTEFAFSGLGLNPHYGTPLNPWDREKARIPGGSSSGAAISVSDNMAVAGIGTDTGGSVRIPSALCGLTGFKPTAARVSTSGAFPLSTTLDSIGPLARSVECCAILDQIMRGESVGLFRDRPLETLTLAVPQTIVFDNIEEKVANDFNRALAKISQLGAKIIDIPFNVLSEIPKANVKGGYAAVEAFGGLRNLLKKDPNSFDPRVAVRIQRGEEMSAYDYIELMNARKSICEMSNKISMDFDALLMPTVPITAPILKDLEASDELYHDINLLMLRNCSFGNFLDRCAISLPIHEEGTAPVGLMVMGETNGDVKLLEIAKIIEATIQK